MIHNEVLDPNNINAQYHHILKSSYLILQVVPQKFTFSSNQAYSEIHKLILEELQACVWCDAKECPHQSSLNTTDNDPSDDEKITTLLNNLNVHSHITPRSIDELTVDHCSKLIKRIEAAANLLDASLKPFITTLLSTLTHYHTNNKSNANLAKAYRSILFDIYSKMKHINHHDHQSSRELIYELLFWDIRRFDACSLPKENAEDSTSALVENAINQLESRLSDPKPENTQLKEIANKSREAIRVGMQPHKFGYEVEHHPDLFNSLQPPDGASVPGTIKRILINDFIAYFADPNSAFTETDKALSDLFYDPCILDGVIRTKRKDAYFQLNQLDAFRNDEDADKLHARLKPLLALNSAEDFQLLQTYLSIFPVESVFHGIDIPSIEKLRIIINEIRCYKSKIYRSQ